MMTGLWRLAARTVRPRRVSVASALMPVMVNRHSATRDQARRIPLIGMPTLTRLRAAIRNGFEPPSGRPEEANTITRNGAADRWAYHLTRRAGPFGQLVGWSVGTFYS